jgi:glycosyltransferase involved in cell wall biosynthesis
LPVICTERCGAAVHLVQDGYNGFITSANNVDALATAMLRMSNLSPERREAMSQASTSLSWQFTPERWARYVQERGEEALKKAGLLRNPQTPARSSITSHRTAIGP